MKRSNVFKLLALTVTIIMLCCATVPAVYAEKILNPAGSHGLYMDPDTSGTSKKFDAFLIDFYSDCDNPGATYFELAGFKLETAPSVKALGYFGISGGGGYAGLQIRAPGEMTGIMSFWEHKYTDLKTKETITLNAKRIFPKGNSTFGGEGEGTNCIYNYEWKDRQWYRMLMMCWKDPESGYTYSGTWFYDYESGQWTMFTYFNTMLVDSYFVNGFGQFVENFSDKTARSYRACRYKNVYALDHTTGKWVSLNTATLKSDNNPKCCGTVDVGISEDKSYFWEIADGTSEEDFVYTEKKLSIVQPETPTLGEVKIGNINIKDKIQSSVTRWLNVEWDFEKGSSPQLSYSLEILNSKGETVFESAKCAPEVQKIETKNIGLGEFTARLTVEDPFGGKATKEQTFTLEDPDAPKTQGTSTASPEESATAPETSSENSSNIVIIVIATVAAVIVIAAIVGVIILSKKKKEAK